MRMGMRLMTLLLAVILACALPMGVLATGSESVGSGDQSSGLQGSGTQDAGTQNSGGKPGDLAFEVPDSDGASNRPSAIVLAVVLVGICVVFVIEGVFSYFVKGHRRWKDKFR